MKYTIKCIHHDESTIEMNFEEDSLVEVIENIKFFLKGCGFSDKNVNHFFEIEEE